MLLVPGCLLQVLRWENGEQQRECLSWGRMTTQEGIGHVQRQDADPIVYPTKPEWWTDRTWQLAT